MEVERILRICVGLSLWTVSAVMGLSLYITFAGEAWYSLLIAAVLVLALEGAKVLSWRRGGWYRLTAIALSSLTILTILGTTLSTIEHRREDSRQAQLQSLQASRGYQGLLRQSELLQAQEKALVARLDRIPGDYSSAMKQVTDSINETRKEMALVDSQLRSLEAGVKSSYTTEAPVLFSSLSTVLGMDEEKLEVLILMFLAILIELSAFSLVGHTFEKGNDQVPVSLPDEIKDQGADVLIKESSVPIRPNDQDTVLIPSKIIDPLPSITPEAYLAEALNHPRRPYLLGRSIVTDRLSIPDREAKNCLETLLEKGMIRRQSKYFIAVNP